MDDKEANKHGIVQSDDAKIFGEDNNPEVKMQISLRFVRSDGDAIEASGDVKISRVYQAKVDLEGETLYLNQSVLNLNPDSENEKD